MRYTIEAIWRELERIEEKHITHREFAAILGIDLSQLHKLRHNEHVSTRTLERIAIALHIPITDLIHPDEPETLYTFDGPAPLIMIDTRKAIQRKEREQRREGKNTDTPQ